MAFHNQTNISSRRYDLDWLRVMLFALLVPYHAAIGFVSYGHNIYSFRNQDVAGVWLEILIYFSHGWRLPCLFAISGMGTFYLYRNIQTAGYLKNRLIRIGLPLLVATFTWNVATNYFAALARGQDIVLFDLFLRRIIHFELRYVSHLWFLVNLLIYSVVCLPIIAWLDKTRNTARLRFEIAFIVSLMLISDLVLKPLPSIDFNINYVFVRYFLFFMAGYWAMSRSPLVWPSLKRFRWVFLLAGVFSFAVLLGYLDYIQINRPNDMTRVLGGNWLMKNWSFHDLLTFSYTLIYTLNAIFWSLSVFAFAHQFLDRKNKFLDGLNRAVYPFYIFHFPVLFAGLYYCRLISLPWYVEFIGLTAYTFVLTGLIYLVFSKFAVSRLLVGLKWRGPS